MTDELVEVVARAISEHTYATIHDKCDCEDWDDMSEKAKGTYRKAATAVLTALAPHIRAREIAAGEAVKEAAHFAAHDQLCVCYTRSGGRGATDAKALRSKIAALDTAAIVETKL